MVSAPGKARAMIDEDELLRAALNEWLRAKIRAGYPVEKALEDAHNIIDELRSTQCDED
jgi:uncharacterized protein (DUF1778 family)